MTKKCSAPGCRSGYDSEKKNNDTSVSAIKLFEFPKNEERRKLWISKVPRANWIPSKYAYLCELHFREEDFQHERGDTNTTRQEANEGKPVVRKRLKHVAFPTVWPNCPSYLTAKPVNQRKTTVATVEAREKKEKTAKEAELKDERARDHFSNLDELEIKVDKSKLPAGLTKIRSENQLLYALVSNTSQPYIKYCLKVMSNFRYEMWSEGKEIQKNRVPDMKTIKLKEEPETAALITDKRKDNLEQQPKRCTENHIFENVVSQVAFKMFNICSKNYKQELNDKIHASKKRERIGNPKQSSHIRKTLKLSSD